MGSGSEKPASLLFVCLFLVVRVWLHFHSQPGEIFICIYLERWIFFPPFIPSYTTLHLVDGALGGQEVDGAGRGHVEGLRLAVEPRPLAGHAQGVLAG